MTAEENYRLLQEIDANRRFILMAYLQNPRLAKKAEALLGNNDAGGEGNVAAGGATDSASSRPK